MKIFDIHGDLFSHFTTKQLLGEVNVYENYHQNNFEKGNVKYGVFNVWIDDESKPARDRALEIFSYGIKEIIESDKFKIIYNKSELVEESNKIQVIIGLEGIDYLDDPIQVYALYQYGVRLILPTWNHDNAFATCVKGDENSGLTPKGIELIKIMNKLGIIIDISHLNDKSANEILDITNQPIIASHSNVRNLCNQPRNLSDELIIRVAKSNGVIGMNAYPAFVSEDANKKNILQLVEHIKYIRNLVGIDHIAFGFDFMDYLTDDALSTFIEGSPFMDDLKNHADIQKIIEELERQEFTQDEIEKIAYKNMFRVINEVLK